MDKEKHQEITCFIQGLREEIISTFEKLENGVKFTRKPWQYQGDGGGEIALLRGEIFEKAAVNFSAIYGDNFPTKEATGPFFATGVSLITHMKNPHAPTVHMNIRYIETKDHAWLGGGYDLTPMGFYYEEDEKHFHKVAKDHLDQIDQSIYPKFYENAKEYFYIPHRKKERGVGGIFFDHYKTEDFSKDLHVWKTVGNSFLETIMPIYEKRVVMPYSKEEKQKQLQLRGHYVEFNLIYDRGTKFGFQSGGNPEAILCSLPPAATW